MRVREGIPNCNNEGSKINIISLSLNKLFWGTIPDKLVVKGNVPDFVKSKFVECTSRKTFPVTWRILKLALINSVTVHN